MDILISDLIEKIKQIFNSSKVLSIDSVYEKINGSSDLRLVLSMNKLLYDNVNIIFTKLIFSCDKDKIKLTKNNFSYLFDINCNYVKVNFNDIDDFGKKVQNIFKNDKFGDDIKILSKFIKSPSTLINTWFKNNDVSDISIMNVNMEKIQVQPCEETTFDFNIDLSNNQTVDLSINKISNNEYILKFKIFEDIYEEKETSLNRLVSVIGNSLKNKIKM
jgi:hypothetical protein